MAYFNDMLDDWTYDNDRKIYINRWDKTIEVKAVRIPGVEPATAKELNQWLNNIAQHMVARRKKMTV